MNLTSRVEAHAQQNLVPLESYRSANNGQGMPSIPNMPSGESVVGIYQNDVNHFICITNAALYIYEHAVWSTLRYEDIYYIKGPIIKDDEVEKQLQILNKGGENHWLSILGDTAKLKATWAFAGMDIWDVRHFLWRVSDDVREDAVNRSLTLNESDLHRLSHYETSNPFYTTHTTHEIELAPMIIRWMKIGIEMEQGYTATIDEYVDELVRRGFLHRVCEFLSTEGRNTVVALLSTSKRVSWDCANDGADFKGKGIIAVKEVTSG